MRIVFCFFIVLVLFSCGNDSRPDVSDIRMDIGLNRFDQDFFALDTNNITPGLQELDRKYPNFLSLYFEFLSPINFMVQQQGRSYNEAVLEYYRFVKPLHDSVQSRYKNLSAVEKDLEEGFRYVKFYYPSFRTPAVYTSVESLNPENPQEIYGAVYYHDTLIISLQMFLGKDFEGYDPTRYFDYIRRRFEPEYIVPNSIRAVTGFIYKDTSDEASLIEQMIEKGKQWYLMDHFLPNVHDSLITLYTGRQVEWCERNEGHIWASILTNNPDLYTVDKVPISTYIGEAPFTQNMESTNSSPGNIGQWVGWRIVEKFAAANPGMSPAEVVQIRASRIFQEAKYRPK